MVTIKEKKKCKLCNEPMLARGLCAKHYHKVYRHDRYVKYKQKEKAFSLQQSKKKRELELKNLNFNGSCQECGKIIDTTQKRAVFIQENKAICKDCFDKKRKLNRFTRKYECCIECKRTDVKHAGNGLCQRCYSRKRQQKKQEQDKK